MANDTSLISIIAVLNKWKKAIFLSVATIGIITAIVLFLKPDYYKAETVFYAANPDLAEPSPLGYSDKRSYVFGTGEDLDRLFSIVTSEETIQYLIDKFNLYQHYGIDSTSQSGRHKMRLAFKDNYSVAKSKYDAIVLAVEDTNPKLAADIANHARDYSDSIAQKLFKNAQGLSMNTNKQNIINQEQIVNKLIDSIKRLKIQYQIIEPSYQARALSDEIVKAQGNLAEAKAKAMFYKNYESKRDSFIKFQANAAGYVDKINQLEKNHISFDKGVNELKRLEQEYGRASDQVSIMKEKDKLISASYLNKFVAVHVVDRAYVPDYKSRPKRAILILASMLIASLAAVSGALMLESFKKSNTN
jgi:capsule polysaccharide export protein KpsE/RkpR